MTIDALRDYLFEGKGASVDTRSLVPGEVFFALPGQRTHGAAFAEEALQKGAAFVVLPEGYPLPSLPKDKVIYHPDPLRLLGELAAQYRKRFDIPVIAVGGSNGKTTTKALLGHILATEAPTLVSPRSWNNAIGLPLTLLRLSPAHRYAVVEIGDNHPGEVRALCQIARPTLGILTNIGADHLEGYQTLERNLATKWELIEFLAEQPNGIAFLNAEDPYLSRMIVPPNLQVWWYGDGPHSIASAVWKPLSWQKAQVQGMVFGEPFSAEVPLWGSYNLLNVLAAVAVARFFGTSLEKIRQALLTFQPEAYRSQVIQRSGKTVIVDAYNANPTSLEASLKALWESILPSQKVALILGQMEELGTHTKSAHREVLHRLFPYKERIAGVLLIGPYWEQLQDIPLPFPSIKVKSISELHELPTPLNTAEVIYLKGSRSQQLEKALEIGLI